MSARGFNKYDELGVRVFIKPSSSGTFGVELYRKKTKPESKGDGDWRMIRIGHIQTYETRDAATKVGFKLAQEVCDEFGFE